MLLPISNALLVVDDKQGAFQLGIDGSSASVLAVPAIALGAGGVVVGPSVPGTIDGNVAAVLSVPAIAMGPGFVTGPKKPGGGGGKGGFAGWPPDYLAFDLLVMGELRRRGEVD